MPKSRPPPFPRSLPRQAVSQRTGSAAFRCRMVELVRTGRTPEELAREQRCCCVPKVDSSNPPPRRSATGSRRPTVTKAGSPLRAAFLLGAAGAGMRRRFASDLLNLTLAGPDVDRNRKKHHDAAQWMPSMNRCWFAVRVVEVRRRYALTVDAREADALERVLSACASTEMVVRSCDAGPSTAFPSASRSAQSSGTTDALRSWDNNRNRRIACREARRHGIAPVPRGHPVYSFMHDGVVCE